MMDEENLFSDRNSGEFFTFQAGNDDFSSSGSDSGIHSGYKKFVTMLAHSSF